jgi:hypothetical protein
MDKKYEAPCANPLLMHAEPRCKKIPENDRKRCPIVWDELFKAAAKCGTHFEDQ